MNSKAMIRGIQWFVLVGGVWGAILSVGSAQLTIGDGTDEGEDREARIEYWMKLHGGGNPANVAIPQAIEKVRELRNRVAQEANVPAFAAAIVADQGKSLRRIAGIPVGPLPANVAANVPLPPPATLSNLPDEQQQRIEQTLRPRVASLTSEVSPGDWTWLGPGNIGGRTRSLVVHPNNPLIMWLGSVAGGIWMTKDAGSTWAPVNDFMASLVVSCMVIDPSDPDTLYAGTGEGFFNGDAFRGAGIFRSDDGGLTWNQLESTRGGEFQWVNRIAVDIEGTILVATRNGLFRSTDHGDSFDPIPVPVSTLPGTIVEHEVLDVRCHPSDAQKLMCSGRGGQVFHSNDGGATWTASTGIPVNHATFGGRVELSYAIANPKVVYASVDENSGAVYRSTDDGKTFSLRGSPKHVSGQGWYANTIWSGDPIDPNLVVVGGLDLHRSDDGGTTFLKISDWRATPNSPHADHHIIVSHAGYDGVNNRTVFFGNDGGIYRANDITAVKQLSGWQELNNGLGITQFYGAAVNHTTGSIVGGAQDNGTLFRTTTAGSDGYIEIAGGDGAFAAANPIAEFYYGEFQWMQLHRSKNGQDSVQISTNLPESGDENAVLFIAPFILDPNDSRTLLAGGGRLWRTKNAEATTPSWTSIKEKLPINRAISAIAVQLEDSNTIWVGHEADSGAVFLSKNGMDASPSWTRRGEGTLPTRHCTRICIDPHDGNHVYATFGGYNDNNVWMTSDGGINWTAVGVGDLPAVPVYDIEVHPDGQETLILANEVGVFLSDDGGQSWLPTNQGPTNCAVFELFWHGRLLYAVTHGRGILRIDASLPPVPLAVEPFAQPAIKSVKE